MSLEPKDHRREAPVAVTLFPVDYPTIEMVTDQGEEIPQQDFTEAQLFLHSIQELERVRAEKKKSKKRKVVVSPTPGGNVRGDEADPTIEGSDALVDVKKEPLGEDDEAMDDIGDPNTTMNGVQQNGTTKMENGERAPVDTADAEDDASEDVIDPRIHYRPMVAELQASIIELNQLINTIDLIRKREFLEDMQCIRENTMEKKEDLEYLIESKSLQLKESSRILLAGVDALTSTVEKESNFFDGVTSLLREWKVCAPIHGNIPKPFRAGEPLAVDCSYISAGSVFSPPTRSIADLSFAELSRTERGLVCVKKPEEYLSRTVQIRLRSLTTGNEGLYTLPPPQGSNMSTAALDRLENTPDDLKTLKDRNVSVLKAVQFSVFCEELFYTTMQEALWNASGWNDLALSSKKQPAKKTQRTDEISANHSGNISVLEVLDDEIRLRLRNQYDFTIKLLDASNMDQLDRPTDHSRGSNALNGNHDGGFESHSSLHEAFSENDFLSETCRFALVLLQQEVRSRHGRNEISRGLMFTPPETLAAPSGTHQPSEADRSNGALASVVSIISHNLLKEEVTRYVDFISANMAAQALQVSATGRILEDGLNQPICDTVRGIYVTPRWKVCPYDSTLAAFDLSIGKTFTTEVLISGTTIRFEDGPGILSEVSSLAGLEQFIEKTVCSQVAMALYRDLISLGMKQASVDLDRASVRLFAAGEWDGSCIGDGRVPDTKPISTVFLEPFFTETKLVSINCILQAVALDNVQGLADARKSSKGDQLFDVPWSRIPGGSDIAKIVWLLQNTTGLPSYFSTKRDQP